MTPELAQRYPEIKNYKVYGIDDASASGRIDINSRGLHVMLHTSQGRLMIDPDDSMPQQDLYLARTSAMAMKSGFSCGVDEQDFPAAASSPVGQSSRALARISGSLLEYRIAVAATEEYVARVGSANDVANAYNEIVIAISRVNVIFERDLGIRLTLVSDETLIENGGNVSFSDGDPAQMFVENQAWIDRKIGNSNYDIGHVFGVSGGGLAFLGSACSNGRKARGVSAVPNPRFSPFYIDFVAHEIGHQFNAEHNFNGTTDSCKDGRNGGTAFEPGSGSTIMAYAGICGAENLQSNSDETFHASSIAAIHDFTRSGGSCYTQIPADPTNPNEPILAALTSKTIPANTAFVLDASASDADGDSLTYQWDQMDRGCPTNASSYGTDIGSNPLFRSYNPQDASMRHFPALVTQLRGQYDDAEVLPCHTRDLDFRVTTRDNRSGQATANVRVSVKNTGTAFRITNLADGSAIDSLVNFAVEWEVAGTDLAPINCANVDIDLLAFANNYASYTVYPLLTTANTGSASVAITPTDRSHPRARIRLKCNDGSASGSYFYDISDRDFAVNGTTATAFDDSAITTFVPVGTAGNVAPSCPPVAQCNTEREVFPGARRGGSSMDYRWLAAMSGLLLMVAWNRRRKVYQG